MEVTTMPPSPASRTEGDDLCEIDVTNMAMHSVTLLICLCGLVGNGAVLWLLSPKKLNYGIFDLAVADFLFLVFAIPLALLFLVEDVSCSSIVPLMYVSFLFQLSAFSYYWGLFLLTAFSLGKDMTLLCKLCFSCWKLHHRLRLLVWGTQYWAFFSVFTVIPMLTTLCPSHEQEHCQTALISMYIVILLLFAAPVVTTSAIDIIKAKCGSQQQQPKRRDIVISLIVLFTLLLSICDFLQQLGYIPMSSQVFFMLTCIHSTIKPFIYFLAGNCSSPYSVGSLRLSLQRVFEEKKEKTACSDDAKTDTVI